MCDMPDDRHICSNDCGWCRKQHKSDQGKIVPSRHAASSPLPAPTNRSAAMGAPEPKVAPEHEFTKRLSNDRFWELYGDCQLGIGCWNGSRKSTNTACQNEDCKFRGQGDKIEVKMRGRGEDSGRYECVACYHHAAKRRGIVLCTGWACVAIRDKYLPPSAASAGESPAPKAALEGPPSAASAAASAGESPAPWPCWSVVRVDELKNVLAQLEERADDLRNALTELQKEVREARAETRAIGSPV